MKQVWNKYENYEKGNQLVVLVFKTIRNNGSYLWYLERENHKVLKFHANVSLSNPQPPPPPPLLYVFSKNFEIK